MPYNTSITQSSAWNSTDVPFSHFTLPEVVEATSTCLSHEYSGNHYKFMNSNGPGPFERQSANATARDYSSRLINWGRKAAAIMKGPTELDGSLNAVDLRCIAETWDHMKGYFSDPKLAEEVFAFLKDTFAGPSTKPAFSDGALRKMTHLFQTKPEWRAQVGDRASTFAENYRHFNHKLLSIEAVIKTLESFREAQLLTDDEIHDLDQSRKTVKTLINEMERIKNSDKSIVEKFQSTSATCSQLKQKEEWLEDLEEAASQRLDRRTGRYRLTDH